MTLHEALTACRDHGHRVRPREWRFTNLHGWVVWVECPGRSYQIGYHGGMPPEPLRLATAGELLGEWETVRGE